MFPTPLPFDEYHYHQVLDPSDRKRHVCKHFDIHRIQDAKRVFRRNLQFFIQLHFSQELGLHL